MPQIFSFKMKFCRAFGQLYCEGNFKDVYIIWVCIINAHYLCEQLLDLNSPTHPIDSLYLIPGSQKLYYLLHNRTKMCEVWKIFHEFHRYVKYFMYSLGISDISCILKVYEIFQAFSRYVKYFMYSLGM